MALLASGHTALETVSQIALTDFVEDCDDLSLIGICHFHFALSCHARIYAARNSEPDFRGNVVARVGRSDSRGSGAYAQSVVGISEPMSSGLDQETGAETEIIAVTTASALDVTGAAGGWLTEFTDRLADGYLITGDIADPDRWRSSTW